MMNRVKQLKLKTLLTIRVLIIFGIFSFLSSIIAVLLSTNALQKNIVDQVKHKIHFIKSYCDEKHKLISQISDEDLIKIVRYHVGEMMKKLQLSTSSFFL